MIGTASYSASVKVIQKSSNIQVKLVDDKVENQPDQTNAYLYVSVILGRLIDSIRKHIIIYLSSDSIITYRSHEVGKKVLGHLSVHLRPSLLVLVRAPC